MHFPAKLKRRIEPPLRIHRGANPLLNTKKGAGRSLHPESNEGNISDTGTPPAMR
jgi:hypothetical protein